MRARAAVVALMSVLFLLPQEECVRAHPHVWVDALAFLGVEEGRLKTVRVQWAFDAFFSNVLFEDFDRNGDGRFEVEEIAAMRAGAFEGLRTVAFFTDLRIDGVAVVWPGFRDFGVAVGKDGTVAYSFSLDLPEPADVIAHRITLSLYDPDYYVDVQMIDTDPFRFRGLGKTACTVTMEEATDTPIYYGLVTPSRAVFHCTAANG